MLVFSLFFRYPGPHVNIYNTQIIDTRSLQSPEENTSTSETIFDFKQHAGLAVRLSNTAFVF